MNKQREAMETTDAELYAAFLMGLHSRKPARKPLTDEEIMSLAVTHDLDATWNKRLFDFARAIERAHGIGEA